MICLDDWLTRSELEVRHFSHTRHLQECQPATNALEHANVAERVEQHGSVDDLVLPRVSRWPCHERLLSWLGSVGDCSPNIGANVNENYLNNGERQWHSQEL